jgi:hypothetical protein
VKSHLQEERLPLQNVKFEDRILSLTGKFKKEEERKGELKKKKAHQKLETQLLLVTTALTIG